MAKEGKRRKFLLCRPSGGFNDILCQLERGYRYAVESGRMFVVDAKFNNPHLRLGELFTVSSHDERFMPSSDMVLEPPVGMLKHLESMTCLPNALQGRLNNYRTKAVGGEGKFVFDKNSRMRISDNEDYFFNCYICIVDAETGMYLSVDRSVPHDEECLVIHPTGGGDDSIQFLSRLHLRRNVADRIIDAIDHLGDDYYAVHIRNTDYRTVYVSCFKKMFPYVSGKKLVIVSDDAECREFARQFFVESEMLSVTTVPQKKQSDPVKWLQPQSMEEYVVMLIDLFTLVYAQELGVVQHTGNGFSGFSRLAVNLRDRPDILEHLFALASRQHAERCCASTPSPSFV